MRKSKIRGATDLLSKIFTISYQLINQNKKAKNYVHVTSQTVADNQFENLHGIKNQGN